MGTDQPTFREGARRISSIVTAAITEPPARRGCVAVASGEVNVMGRSVS
jgi:hypothetical protein